MDICQKNNGVSSDLSSSEIRLRSARATSTWWVTLADTDIDEHTSSICVRDIDHSSTKVSTQEVVVSEDKKTVRKEFLFKGLQPFIDDSLEYSVTNNMDHAEIHCMIMTA